MNWLWLFEGALTVGVGLALGSFSALAITRIPYDSSIVSPRSRCSGCGHKIRAKDNIPILSWLLLQGKCRDCRSPISVKYPLTELLMGLLSALIYLRFIPDAGSLTYANLAATGLFVLFTTALVIATMVDIGHRIIPDSTSILAAPIGVAGLWCLGAIGFSDPMIPTALQGALGGLATGGIFAIFAIIARLLMKRDGIGWGDVKLMVMISSFLGAYPGGIMVLLLGSLLGALFGFAHLIWTRKRSYLPFGPALAASAICYLLYGESLVKAIFPGAAYYLGL